METFADAPDLPLAKNESASKKKVICERNKGITNQSRIQQRFVKYAKKNSNKTAVIDAE